MSVREEMPGLICSPMIEFKTGYFFFTNDRLKKTYPKNGLNIQLCASYPLKDFTHKWSLQAYGCSRIFPTIRQLHQWSSKNVIMVYFYQSRFKTRLLGFLFEGRSNINLILVHY